MQCSECTNQYHVGKCSGVTKTAFKAMKSEEIADWICSTCRVHSDRQYSAEKADKSAEKGQHIRSEVLEEIRKLAEAVKVITDKVNAIEKVLEMQALKADTLETKLDTAVETTKEIERSVDYISKQYDEMLQKVDDQSKTIEGMQDKIGGLETMISERETVIKELQLAVDRTEQYSRRNNIEIQGIPKQDTENLVSVVQDLAEKLQLPVPEEAEIESVHRLRAKEEKTPAIMARFTSRKTRDQWIEKRMALRLDNIYINENLTPRMKNLLWKTKSAAKANSFQFVWTRNGKILARKAPGATVIQVEHDSDLDKIR